MKKKKPPDFHQRSPSTRSSKYMRIRNILEMRQPAVIVLRTLDPWLCVPAFQRVCLYIRYVYFSFSTIFTFVAIVNRIFAFFRIFSFFFRLSAILRSECSKRSQLMTKIHYGWLSSLLLFIALLCCSCSTTKSNTNQPWFSSRKELASAREYPLQNRE